MVWEEVFGQIFGSEAEFKKKEKKEPLISEGHLQQTPTEEDFFRTSKPSQLRQCDYMNF